jgi:GNAT superfamily N-acetyltransferase
MRIRAAEPSDLAEILPLVDGLAQHHGDVPSVTAASLFRDLFTDPRWLHGLVAERQGKILGYAALLPLARLHHGQRGMDLHHLFVAPHHRGGGTGTALLQAALSFAKGLDCSYMTLSTHPKNAKAKAYYLAQGFFASPPAPDRFAFDLSVWHPKT